MNLRRYILIISTLLFCHLCRAVTGDGNVIAEKRIVHQFSHLTINGPFKIITSNDPHSDFFIKIETDKNLQEYVTVTETGNSVFVNLKPGIDIRKFTKLVLYIDNRNIQSLTINSNTNEPSDISLPVICHDSQLRINGSIPISVRVQVICHQVSHLTDSTGMLDPNAINYARLVAQINNTRSTTIYGDIEEALIINDGTGEINAADLKVDLLRVRNNNVASIEVYSDHDLKVNNTASGYVYYSGSGAITELKQAGQGIVCRDESLITDISPSSHVEVSPQIKSVRDIGFNTDSLWGAMMVRDQRHRC